MLPEKALNDGRLGMSLQPHASCVLVGGVSAQREVPRMQDMVWEHEGSQRKARFKHEDREARWVYQI